MFTIYSYVDDDISLPHPQLQDEVDDMILWNRIHERMRGGKTFSHFSLWKLIRICTQKKKVGPAAASIECSLFVILFNLFTLSPPQQIGIVFILAFFIFLPSERMTTKTTEKKNIWKKFTIMLCFLCYDDIFFNFLMSISSSSTQILFQFIKNIAYLNWEWREEDFQNAWHHMNAELMHTFAIHKLRFLFITSFKRFQSEEQLQRTHKKMFWRTTKREKKYQRHTETENNKQNGSETEDCYQSKAQRGVKKLCIEKVRVNRKGFELCGDSLLWCSWT